MHYRWVFGRIALSMMIGRAGGWVEWSGAVKGRAGVWDGVGVWGGGGARRDGVGSDHRPILDCSTMMTGLCVVRSKHACFVKVHHRRFGRCGCSGYGGVTVGTWCMCCVYKATVFRKQNYRRFDEGHFTKVGCNINMLKQCIIVGYLGGSLS